VLGRAEIAAEHALGLASGERASLQFRYELGRRLRRRRILCAPDRARASRLTGGTLLCRGQARLPRSPCPRFKRRSPSWGNGQGSGAQDSQEFGREHIEWLGASTSVSPVSLRSGTPGKQSLPIQDDVTVSKAPHMINTDVMDQLMVEAAQLADCVYVEATPDGTSWRVLMDDAHTDSVAVELDHPRNVLTLSAEVGLHAVADQDKATFHDLVLRYNHHAEMTGGLRLSLMPATPGSFSLMRDIAASDLTAQSLADQLTDFSHKALAWRELIAQPPTQADKPHTETWPLPGMRA
jgi:hypothetical protein